MKGKPVMGPPWPATEWDEIVPGLYQGCHDYQVEGFIFSTKLKGVRQFDYVVSLYTEPLDPDTYPDDDIAHTIFEIPDDTQRGVYPTHEADLFAVVDTIVEAMTLNQRVLVRCQAGYNRSGLVVAMTLMRRGMTAEQAISIIRQRRSSWALCNPAFVSYLTTNEEKIRGGTENGQP